MERDCVPSISSWWAPITQQLVLLHNSWCCCIIHKPHQQLQKPYKYPLIQATMSVSGWTVGRSTLRTTIICYHSKVLHTTACEYGSLRGSHLRVHLACHAPSYVPHSAHKQGLRDPGLQISRPPGEEWTRATAQSSETIECPSIRPQTAFKWLDLLVCVHTTHHCLYHAHLPLNPPLHTHTTNIDYYKPYTLPHTQLKDHYWYKHINLIDMFTSI